MGLLGWRRLVGATLCLLVTAAAGTTARELQPYNDTHEYTDLQLHQRSVTRAPLPYRCDFESEKKDKFCGMSTFINKNARNYYHSRLAWTLSSKDPVSEPPNAAAGKHFAYITTDTTETELESLDTPRLMFNSSNVKDVCVSFAYYISNDTASLTVRFMSSDADSFGEDSLSNKGNWFIYNDTVEAKNLKYVRFVSSFPNKQESSVVAIDHLSVEQCAPTTPAPTRATTTPRQSGSGKTVSPGSPTESETTAGRSYNTENTPSTGPEKRDALSPLAVGAIVSGMIVGGLLLAIVVLMIVLFKPKPPATTEEAAELNSEASGEVSATDLASGTGGE